MTVFVPGRFWAGQHDLRPIGIAECHPQRPVELVACQRFIEQIDAEIQDDS